MCKGPNERMQHGGLQNQENGSFFVSPHSRHRNLETRLNLD